MIGALLIAASLFLYLNPALTNRNQASSATANAALAPASASSTSAQLVATAAPAVAAIATPPEAPAALVAPAATVVPTDLPPTATAVPTAKVPDLHDSDEKDAQDKLTAAGLKFSKVDQCSGTDKGDSKAKKHRVQCQNPATGADVPLGTTVEYVIR